MEFKDFVAIGSVVVALIGFAVQQWRTMNESRKKDDRILNKLKILYYCQARGLSENEIVNEYKRSNPQEPVDEYEIRKAIYEMLVDETLLFIGDSETYEARSHTSRGQGVASAANILRAQQIGQQQQ